MRLNYRINVYAIAAAAIVLLAGSCNGVPSLKKSAFFDNSAIASPCIVEQDSTRIILRDYFPKMEEKDTLLIPVSEQTPFISLLDVYSAGDKGTLVVKNMTERMVKQCNREKAPFITTRAIEGNDGGFYVIIQNGAKEVAVLWQNTLMEKNKGITVISDTLLMITVPSNAAKMERSYIRLYMANEFGPGNDILVPLSFGKVVNNSGQLNRHDKHTQILYSLLIDRFSNGNPSNDWAINSETVKSKVDYWGGDLAGITQKIKSGYFDGIGITTIWLSPITQNPYDAWGQIHDPETQFSGYHGYWPIYVTKVDDRFGTEDELRQLLDAAHSDNKNVILDYVSNHMHINSPTLKAHPDWTTPSNTPDGRPNRQLWDEYRLTTWFDDHIPTLDLEKEEISAQLTDSALFWMQNYDFDGFRHDATKHIPEGYWRLLTRKILDSLPQKSLYQIGETYGSLALISSYVKPGMLDGQFDFNVYDAFIDATTTPDGSFENLAKRIKDNLEVYGYHNLMGYISGNHDRPRYISIAGGDIIPGEDTKLAGWKRDIGVKNKVGYSKLSMLHALNFTLPGIPCIYYGDEYGQPGANDPDNRRWMKFSDYNEREQLLLGTVKYLSSLRKSSMSLLYGDYYQLAATKDVFVYMRAYMGDYVIVAMNKADSPKSLVVTLPLGFSYYGDKDIDIYIEPCAYNIMTNK
ncbi:MAG: alpha-amylase family glycosyl hydrolase [Bacteroidales bacterium]|nr:alpha-amylase family glycosyl hydrolase [Bacteroidales bacterium]